MRTHIVSNEWYVYCKCDDKCKQLKMKERLLIALISIIITFIYSRLYLCKCIWSNDVCMIWGTQYHEKHDMAQTLKELGATALNHLYSLKRSRCSYMRIWYYKTQVIIAGPTFNAINTANNNYTCDFFFIFNLSDTNYSKIITQYLYMKPGEIALPGFGITSTSNQRWICRCHGP